MNAFIIALPAVIIGAALALIGAALALAGVVLGSQITAKAMGGWFNPDPDLKTDSLDEPDGADNTYIPRVQSIRDIERNSGAGEEESYPGGEEEGIPDLPFEVPKP